MFSDSDVYLIEDPKERPLLQVNLSPPAPQSCLSLTVVECENTLRGIKQRKAVCPDGVPGWRLKDYVEDLAQIFNCTTVSCSTPNCFDRKEWVVAFGEPCNDQLGLCGGAPRHLFSGRPHRGGVDLGREHTPVAVSEGTAGGTASTRTSMCPLTTLSASPAVMLHKRKNFRGS